MVAVYLSFAISFLLSQLKQALYYGKIIKKYYRAKSLQNRS